MDAGHKRALYERRRQQRRQQRRRQDDGRLAQQILRRRHHATTRQTSTRKPRRIWLLFTAAGPVRFANNDDPKSYTENTVKHSPLYRAVGEKVTCLPHPAV